jgi:hypothetical protein
MTFRNTISILALGFVFILNSQNTKILFNSEDVLELSIRLDQEALLNDRVERKEHNAQLWHLENGELNTQHDIKLVVRGKNRTKQEVCPFPPLTVNFKKKQVENSIFEGQNKLKLVTHCRSQKSFKDYIFKEYLIYKLYESITEQSLKVRLCKITWIDQKKPDTSESYYGFLIEDIDDAADRNSQVEFDKKLPTQQSCDNSILEKLTFFQYMIGNLDWSIPHRHNIKLIKNEQGGLPVPIPYDFDASGFVNAPYAVPPGNFNLTSVRSRLFWGLCRSENGYNSTAAFYKEKKSDLLNVVSSFELLSEKSKKSTLKYLESFYAVLENEKQFNKKIVRACRAEHKHLFE